MKSCPATPYRSSEITWNLFIVAARSAKIKARRRLALIIQRKLWRTTNKKPGVRKKLPRGHIRKKLPVKGKIEIKQEDDEAKPTEGKKKAILINVKTEPGEELKKEFPATKYTGKKGQPKHKKPIKEVCLPFFYLITIVTVDIMIIKWALPKGKRALF